MPNQLLEQRSSKTRVQIPNTACGPGPCQIPPSPWAKTAGFHDTLRRAASHGLQGCSAFLGRGGWEEKGGEGDGQGEEGAQWLGVRGSVERDREGDLCSQPTVL